MKLRVYVETSVISYLTGKPSRDLVVAAHQQLTHELWEGLDRFEAVASELVLDECAAGDIFAAEKRLAVVSQLPLLEYSEAVANLARQLLIAAALPKKAADDAMHVAYAAVNGIDVLVTWNCKHIANPATRLKIDQTCIDAGYVPPIFCTPEELLGVE